MKRALVLAGLFAIAAIGGALTLLGGPREVVRTIGDRSALADLPRRDVVPMLAPEDGTAPDLVIFMDGRDGWFELDLSALPARLDIGFFGPRLFDAFTGNTHVPLYCWGSTTPPGKVIWVVQGGEIARDFAFCNRRRMDLGPLRPFASPVELVTDHLTRAEVEALIPVLAADPSRALVARPIYMSPFSQRVVLTPPLMWFSYDEGSPRHEVEAMIEAAIMDHMGAVEVSFRRRPDTNPNLALPAGEIGAANAGGANMVMQRDGGYIVLPRLWAEPYEIWIDCHPEACALANTLDLDATFAQGRNLDILRRAMASVTVPARTQPPTPLDWFPTLADLEDDTVNIADPVDQTYQIRYITRS